MNITIVIVLLFILHFSAINGMSLISGKAKITGFLEDNSFFWSRAHVIGMACLALAALTIFVSEKNGFLEIGLIIAVALYFVDLIFIGRFFLYGRK